MRYPVALMPDEQSGGFTAVIPASPGCVTEGDSHREALAMARDAAEGWMLATLDVGGEIPGPGPVERHLDEAPEEYRNAVWAFVDTEMPAVT